MNESLTCVILFFHVVLRW